jgi:hypothetical protein
MARLTDTQRKILFAASQRDDGGVELPDDFQGNTAAKVLNKLIRVGLLEEVCASASLPVWRRDDQSGAIALRITSVGLSAIESENEAMAPRNEDDGRLATVEVARSTPAAITSWLAGVYRPSLGFHLWTVDNLTAAVHRNFGVRLSPAGARSVIAAEHARRRPDYYRRLAWKRRGRTWRIRSHGSAYE